MLLRRAVFSGPQTRLFPKSSPKSSGSPGIALDIPLFRGNTNGKTQRDIGVIQSFCSCDRHKSNGSNATLLDIKVTGEACE